MHTRIAALAAFAASLYPFTAFWLASPDLPRRWLLALFAGGIAVALLCVAFDGVLDAGRLVVRAVQALAIGWLLVCIGVAGPTAAVAFLLTGTAALALGARLTVALQVLTPLERAAVAYLTGMALSIAVLSLCLRFRIHYPWVYAVACLAVVAWQRKPLAALLSDSAAQVRGWTTTGAPVLVVLAALVWLWGAVGTLTPIAAYDDLAYHLRMPYELLVRHHYTFDVVRQAWAASPWAADLAFAIPFLVSNGNEGVKAWVAGSYHLASAVLLLGLLARRVPRCAALWFLMAYLSIPMVMTLNHTLHTEGPSAAIALAVFALWAFERERASLATLVVAALLLSLLGALKSSNLVASLFLGLLWVPQLWAQVRRQPRTAVVLLLAFSTVLIPYAIAWLRTGNPVLPLFNHVFKSPYFGTHEFTNTYYAGMFDLQLFQRLFLEGKRFLESLTDVAGGLALFLLLPPALVLLAWRGDRERRAALAVALAYSLVLLSKQQYLRYLFPVMGIAIFACSRVWDEGRTGETAARWLWKGWWTALLALAVALGVLRMPQGFWQTSEEQLLHMWYPQGRADYLVRFAPERALNQRINADWGVHARVLYIGDFFGADLHGTPLYPGWLSPSLLRDAERITDKASVGDFLRRNGVTHVVPAGPDKGLSPVHEKAARTAEAWVREHGKVVATSGNLSLVELEEDVIFSRELWRMPAGEQYVVTAAYSPWGSVPVRGGSLVRFDVEGTCDALGAVPWLHLQWKAKGQPLSFRVKMEACLADEQHPNGRFRIGVQASAPVRADEVDVRMGNLNATPVRVTAARVRTLGP